MQRHHITAAQAAGTLPGPPTPEYPDGEPFAELLRHGTMSLELYAPVGRDLQQPHDQDELYIVVAGTARFVRGADTVDVAVHDVLFVPAGMEHRFVDFSDDFATWVVFWGPTGGE